MVGHLGAGRINFDENPRLRVPNTAGNTGVALDKAFHQQARDRWRAEHARLLGRGLEEVVRPAVPAKAYRLLDRLIANRRKPGEEAEASIRWGGQSDFRVDELKAPELPKVRGVKVVGGGGGEPEIPPTEDSVVYSEESRSTHVLRVENPEDPQQYVEVEVIDSITFQATNGRRVTFELDNPA